MVPSREPIQVRLEDTGGPRLQCKPPVQVKILRRPQTVSNSSTNQTNDASAAAAAANGRLAHLDSFTDGTLGSAALINDSQTVSKSSNCNSEQHQQQPQNSGTIKTGQLNYSTVAAASLRNAINTNSNRTINQKSTAPNDKKSDGCSSISESCSSGRTKVDPKIANNGNPIVGNPNTKKPMKTYQERVDEYAKARLRILGSAFPENDDLLTANDDVNRILNSDSTNSNAIDLEGSSGNRHKSQPACNSEGHH